MPYYQVSFQKPSTGKRTSKAVWADSIEHSVELVKKQTGTQVVFDVWQRVAHRQMPTEAPLVIEEVIDNA